MKLLNKQYRLISCLLISSIFATLILITSNFLFSIILFRVDTLSEVLYFINGLSLLDNVFIVRLAINMSDMSFSVVKVIGSISLVSVIALGFLLLIFDLCKYNCKLLTLRKNILVTFLMILIKYVILIVLLFINYSTYMSPVPLFNTVALINIMFDTLFVLSYIILVTKYVLIVRK